MSALSKMQLAEENRTRFARDPIVRIPAGLASLVSALSPTGKKGHAKSDARVGKNLVQTRTIRLDSIRFNEYYSGMSGRLKDELKQSKPFPSLEVEAYLNLLRTADLLGRAATDILKVAELSEAQYNILRILRGSSPSALACGEIGERMISRDPDITRLLDRLEARGLVKRVRDEVDRRVVRARITEKGLQLTEKLTAPMLEMHKRQLQHLGAQKLQTLVDLLEQARDPQK